MAATIVIFGASGDLTTRKLVPALYWLFRKRRLPESTCVVGFSRTPHSHDAWRDELGRTTAEIAGSQFDSESWQAFAQNVYYHPGDVAQFEDYRRLSAFLDQRDAATPATRIFYLATAPRFFEPTIEHLGRCGLAQGAADDSAAPRIVVEKPFGTDLASARRLNERLHQVFAERQVFRIDHYLGKETVQNILVLRLANTVFEPIWNRNYIDHVEITAAEEVAVGRRGSYYDSSGVLRDMFQNHLLQLLMVTAMEAPSRFEADLVRNEKVKVLEAIRPMSADEVAQATVRAQYAGYRDEPGVPSDSQTATFAAVRLLVDNWRWQGVPFYLRSGKALDCRTTQIVIGFRAPPHMVFGQQYGGRHEPNRLIIQIQPAEGVQLHLQTKVPDAGMQLRLTDLDFRFDRHFRGSMPDAYERLLLDVLANDPSLFARSDEVELSWGIVDPILDAWETTGRPELATYPPGDWGPDASREWIARDGRQWYDVCPVLS